MSNSMINDMTEGNIPKHLVRFAMPFMLANLLQTVYTLTDLAIVGQFVGSDGLSAVSISGQLTILFMSFGMGIGGGGQIYMSQIVGKKELHKINTVVGTTFTLKLTFSLIFLLVGTMACEPLLKLINTPAEAMDQAYDYMFICCFGIPFLYVYNVFSANMRGMGDSKRPMYFIAVSAVSNVVLDLLFVAVFEWGSAGAALATVISQVLCCIFALTYVYKRREAFGFDFKLKSFKVDWVVLKNLLRLSLPLIMTTMCIQFSMSYIMSHINTYGIIAASVTGVGNKLYSVMSVVTQSIQSSTGTMVGQNMGAGKIDRAKKVVFSGWLINLSFFVVIALMALFLPRQIFSLFNREAAVLDMAVEYMRISILQYLAFALMSPPMGFIMGTGFTTLNFAISFLDGVLGRIGISVLFGVTLGMGLQGFWWGSVAASFISVILGSAYFFSGKWKKRHLTLIN